MNRVREWLIIYEPYYPQWNRQYLAKGDPGKWRWSSNEDEAYVFTYKAALVMRERVHNIRKFEGGHGVWVQRTR